MKCPLNLLTPASLNSIGCVYDEFNAGGSLLQDSGGEVVGRLRQTYITRRERGRVQIPQHFNTAFRRRAWSGAASPTTVRP